METTEEVGLSIGGNIVTRADVIKRLARAGEHLGNAIAGYRDQNNYRAARGLYEAATAMLDAKTWLAHDSARDAACDAHVKQESAASYIRGAKEGAAAERERCAKIAETHPGINYKRGNMLRWRLPSGHDIAFAIRALSDPRREG